MKLQEVAWLLADKLKLGNHSVSGSNKISQCPDDADLLAYVENRLSPKRRAELESHMGDCDSCRETLFLFVRVPGEELENADAVLSMSDDLVRRQAERVLAYIERDEASRPSERPERQPVKRERSGFFVSYAQLGFAATLVIAAVIGLSQMTPDTREAHREGTQALASGIKNDRRITSFLSGDFPYAPNPVTRGERKTNDIQFDHALDKLKFAEDESAPAESRQALAWVYLSRDEPGDAEKALSILEKISPRAEASPELLNDIGVALSQLERFNDAVTAFSQALDKKPDFQKALFNRGLAYTRAWFYNAAREDFQDFIKITSDEEWKQEAIDRLNKLPQ